MNSGFIISLMLVWTASINAKPTEHKKHHKFTDDLQSRGPGCGGKPADVFFLLDTSSSIWHQDFKKQLNFVQEVVDLFEIGPDETRVAVATFSTSYHLQFGLNWYDQKDQLQNAISNIPYRGGDTNTEKALRHMHYRGFHPKIKREGVAKIAIVLTDGRSRHPEETVFEAEMAKQDDIHIFAIGIGDRSKYNYTELVEMGSKPTEHFVFEVSSFDALESLKGQLALYECEVEEPLPMMDQPPCERAMMADVMFVFDSAAMGNNKTEIIQDYIGGVVEEFNFEDNLMRAGVVSKDCHGGDIALGEHSEKAEFLKDLRNLDYPDLSHVIRRMSKHSFTEEEGAREMARKMAVVFVDDKLHLPKRIYHEIEEAKADDVEVFVVAIGDAVVDDEISNMATTEDYILRIPNYDAMMGTCGDLTNKVCSALSSS